MTLVLRRKPEKVTPPESDIQDVLKHVEKFFAANPERESCTAGIFGHDTWTINKTTAEADVRAAAAEATTYTKV